MTKPVRSHSDDSAAGAQSARSAMTGGTGTASEGSVAMRDRVGRALWGAAVD